MTIFSFEILIIIFLVNRVLGGSTRCLLINKNLFVFCAPEKKKISDIWCFNLWHLCIEKLMSHPDTNQDEKITKVLRPLDSGG